MIKFPYLLSLGHNTKGIVISIVPCLKKNLKSEEERLNGLLRIGACQLSLLFKMLEICNYEKII